MVAQSESKLFQGKCFAAVIKRHYVIAAERTITFVACITSFYDFKVLHSKKNGRVSWNEQIYRLQHLSGVREPWCRDHFFASLSGVLSVLALVQTSEGLRTHCFMKQLKKPCLASPLYLQIPD